MDLFGKFRSLCSGDSDPFDFHGLVTDVDFRDFILMPSETSPHDLDGVSFHDWDAASIVFQQKVFCEMR